MQLHNKCMSKKNQETGTCSVYVEDYTDDDENGDELIASFWSEFVNICNP